MPTTLWRKREESAVIIDDSGSAVICDHCPCCDGVVEFDRELAHAYDSVPVKVTVTLQPGCFDKDGVTSASLYFTSTVYADESRITVLFEEARRYTLGSAGNHPVPDEYSVNPITGVVKYAWYFYVGPEAVTSIFVNLVQPKGELEDNLSYAEIAYSSDVKLEVDSADDEPCVGDYISHSFTFSPTEALAGYGIVISLIYFPAVEATVTTDGDVELSDHIPTDLAGEMGWGPLYIVVPGLIHIEYANSDTEQELGEYTIVPGSTISVSAPALNTCGDADTLSITIACLAEAKAEAVTVEVYDGEDKIENIGDYIEESGGTPFSFGTGWIYDSGTATYSFSKEVVALPRNSAASLSIVAKVEVPSSIEDTNPISSEDTLSIYLPDTQVSITAPTLDLYKGVGTLKIVVFCVDENDFTPPSVSFSMGGTPVDINDYAEWDDESMINFAAGNWVISGGDATWEYDLEANDRADPGDVMTITVTYLGVDYTGTITFDVEGTLNVTIPPMHRYGEDKIISVEIVNAPRAWSGTPSFTKNGPGAFSDHVQWMTSASWDASTWLRTARGIGEGATFSVDVEYMKLPVVTKTVTIKDEVLCSGGITADQVYSGGAIMLTAEISASEKLVQARLPTPSTSLVPTGTVTIEPFVPAQWTWEMDEEEGVLNFLGSVRVEGEGTVEFKVFLGTSESGVLLEGCTDTCEVKVLTPEGTITTCPELLHTLGDNTVGKSFVATVTQCSIAPSISIEDDNGGSLHGTIGTIGVSITETETGSGEWNISCGLYANSIPADLPVHIKIMSGDMELAECTVDVTDVLEASVTMPSTACLGEPLSGIQIFIGGVDEEYIPRFVYGTHAVVVQECDPVDGITLVKSGTDSFWTDVDGFTYLSGGVWQWGDNSETEVAQSVSGTYLTALPATVTLTVEQIRAGETNTEISGGGASVSISYDVTIAGPGNMHVAGCSKLLTITAPCYEHGGLPEISVFDSNNQTFHSFIGGSGSVEYGYLIFGESLWVDGVWSYALRISSVSAYNPITIQASKYGVVVAETTFSTSNAYSATVSPGVCYVGKPFNLSIDIDSIPNGSMCAFDPDDISVSESISTGSDYTTGWSSQGSWNNAIAEVAEYDSSGVKVTITGPNSELIESHVITIRDTGGGYIYIDVPVHPDDLHVYGGAKPLTVTLNIDGETPVSPLPTGCTVTATFDGASVSVGDYLELGDGSAINFSSGWVDGVWSESVRAKSAPREGALSLIFSYTYNNTTSTKTIDISIRKELRASISAPSRVGVGEAFTVSISVSWNDALPRLPSSGGVSVSHGNLDGSATPIMMSGGGSVSFSAFDSGVCTVTGCSISAECEYEIRVSQSGVSDANLELDGHTITVSDEPLSLDELIDAINERMTARGLSRYTYDPNNPPSLSTIRGWANTAISGYKTSVSSTGEYTSVGTVNTNYDPPSAWISHAYGVVCSAVIRSGNYTRDRSSYSGGVGLADPGCETVLDPPVWCVDHYEYCKSAKSMSSFKSEMENDFRNNWSSSASSVGDGTALKWMWVWVKCDDDYLSAGRCEGYVNRVRLKLSDTSSVARKVEFYAYTDWKSYDQTSFSGHNLPSTTGSKWFSSYCPANGVCSWTNWHAPNTPVSVEWNITSKYSIRMITTAVHYQFKHR